MTRTVLILGPSGKIGHHAAEAFAAAGWTVRRFNRKTDDMTTSAMGADVIVNGLNPAGYKNWETLVPAYTRQVIDAARASGATVIIPGNIYNYGDQPGVLNERTKQAPNTRKGRIRVEMEAAYRDAGVRTIILRAGNFLDPNGNGDFMSLLMLRNISRGVVTTLGDPAIDQAYAYVPDWARAAVALAEQAQTGPDFLDLPFPGHTFSIDALTAMLQDQMGKKLRIKRFPWWLMNLASPVWALAREMREMRYLYEMPHRIDDGLFNQLLPQFAPTPLEQVVARCLAHNIHPNQAMRPGDQAVLTK